MNAKYIKYQLMQFFMLLLVVPIVSQLPLALAVYLGKNLRGISEVMQRTALGTLGIIAIMLVGVLAYWWGKKIKTLPATFSGRYKLMFIALIYAIYIYTAILHTENEKLALGYIFYLPVIVVVIYVSEFIFSIPEHTIDTHVFLIACIVFSSCILVYFTAFAQGLRHQGVAKNVKLGGGVFKLLLFALLSALAVCGWTYYDYQKNLLSISTSKLEAVSARKDIYDYWPYNDFFSTLTPLRGESTLLIEKDFPLLDSATAFFPIVASAVYKVYDHAAIDRYGLHKLLQSSRTPYAYEKLIAGEVDLIFVLQPSDAQRAAAKEKGLELTFTPIGKEAFVFLVNAQNPVTSLTTEQVRDIYSGKISNWQDVGGNNTKIMPFQRSQGSGSQTAMDKQVMKGIKMREPLEEEFYEEMGGIYRGVADYRNAENAVGYSFRFYSTEMQKSGNIRLLAIDGIEPTAENIRNGRYPFIADFYIVSARPLSDNALKLKDWFLSDQGQALIQDVGYVPVKAQPTTTMELIKELTMEKSATEENN